MHMALRMGFEDRGFGRIYRLLQAEVPHGWELKSKAELPGGKALPTAIYRAPKAHTYVLVAPLMSEPLRVVVQLVDGGGAVVEAIECDLGGEPLPQDVPTTSQFLASGLDDIRYVDLNPTASAPWLELTQVIDFEDGTEVVHAHLVCLAPQGVLLGQPGLSLHSLEGRPLKMRAYTVLDKSSTVAPGGAVTWHYQLSWRIPAGTGAFVAWVHFAASAVQDGFLVVENWLLDKLRGQWQSITHADSNKGDYHRWFMENARASDRTLHLQALESIEALVLPKATPPQKMNQRYPLFSIVVPVFETPLAYLQECVDSVRAQTYPRWELVLVNASPANEALTQALAAAAASDERVRVVTLEKNRGIALNTRAGIQAATGDYLCFLDHDDFVEPNALYEYAQVAKAHPEVDLIYCDEDLWLNGRYHSGYFKPDFDVDLLLNQNYVTHWLCLSRKALQQVANTQGLPGPELDGAQDYALTLAVAANGGRLWHVRKFLYHWRAHAGSTAISHTAKTWTDNAGRLALEGYLRQRGIAAQVAPGVEQNIYQIDYEVPAGERVSLVVVRNSGNEAVYGCLGSVAKKSTYPLAQVIVVNPYEPLDKARLERLERLEGVAFCEVEAPQGAGPAVLKNLGAAKAKGSWLLFVDDRCRVAHEHWIELLLGPCVGRPEVAVSGAGLVYEDGLVRHCGICVPQGMPRFINHGVPAGSEDADYYRRMPRLSRGVSAVSGAAMLVRAQDFAALGGFDEGYRFGLDDVDLCLRARQTGHGVVVVPRAELIWLGSAPNGRVLPFSYVGQPASPRSLKACLAIKHDEGLFRQRWSRYWGEGDPLYNPQLAKESCHYQMYRW